MPRNQSSRRRYHIRRISSSFHSFRTRHSHHCIGRNPLLRRCRRRLPRRRRPILPLLRTINIPMATSLESSMAIYQYQRVLGKTIPYVLPSHLHRRRLSTSLPNLRKTRRSNRRFHSLCSRTRLGTLRTRKKHGVQYGRDVLHHDGCGDLFGGSLGGVVGHG